MNDETKLRSIKTLHTVVWAVFAGSIVAIPFFAYNERLTAAFALIGFVFIECVVLALNGMRCPLTDIAARFTDDRRDNFDIYLPLWLARNNKHIFGWLYAAGVVFSITIWLFGPFGGK